MGYFVYSLLGAVALLYGLWVFYIAWTHLEKAEEEGKLSTFSLALGKPVKYVGLAIDVAVNLTIVSLLYMDFPREWLVTTRMVRYLKGKDGWRKKTTQWACTHLLDAFDIEGKHCKY